MGSVIQPYRRRIAVSVSDYPNKQPYKNNSIRSPMQCHTSRADPVLQGLTPFSTAGADQTVRDFRTPIPDGEKIRIRSMLFGGFQKCLYPTQKFDSDPERRFAVILDNDEDVLKWFKPARGDFQIYPNRDQSYEPDFVVETATEKFLCEPKRASEVSNDIVQSKADAAAIWCEHATVHAKTHGGKPWTYLLIPHDQISAQMSLSGLAAGCTHAPQVQGTGGHGKD